MTIYVIGSGKWEIKSLGISQHMAYYSTPFMKMLKRSPSIHRGRIYLSHADRINLLSGGQDKYLISTYKTKW